MPHPNPEPSAMERLVQKHHVTIRGAGDRTILFAHGFGCDQTIWYAIAPAFTSHFRVITFDYVGCGLSDLSQYHPAHYHNLAAYAADVISLCDILALSSVYFVGHSVSGAIGILSAIQRPDLFKKLITIGPSPRYLNDGVDYIGGFNASDITALLDMMELNYFEWAGYLAPMVVGSQNDPEASEKLKSSFLRIDPVIARTFAKVTFLCDIRSDLPQIAVPVVILYCLEDVIVPMSVVEYLHQHIPMCSIVPLAATGHYPQLTNPEAVINAIKQEVVSV